MTRYSYKPLANPGRSIRLLRLMPGPHIAARIECELFHAKIDESPPYEALSYTWGDPDQTRNIDLSTYSFPATVNLEVALRYLRHRDKPRVLWVDAVCINQSDLQERAAQVRMMWDIYKASVRVVVWLGPEVGDSAIAMESIARKDCQANAEARKAAQKRPEGQAHTSSCNCAAGNFDNYPSRIGIRALLSSRWFTRMWVLQEVAAAKDILVVCGENAVTGQDFFDELHSLSTNSMNFSVPKMIRSCYHPVMLMNKRHETSGEVSAGSIPIIELIERFRSSDAQDPRDKLFALLAFSSDASQSPKLQPDYTVSEEDLARRIVEFAFPKCVIGPTPPAGKGVAFEVEGLLLGDIAVGSREWNYPIDSSTSKAPRAVWNQTVREIFKKDNGWEIMVEDERTLGYESAVLLLRGASRPSVVRLHESEVVVEMLATPEPTKVTGNVFRRTRSTGRPWLEALDAISNETDGWMKFKLTWNPLGPPHPSTIKRYIPTPNSMDVQQDAQMESLKENADNGSQDVHNCQTISFLWAAMHVDRAAIEAGTSRFTMTLHNAAYHGRVRTLKLLLDANANINSIHDGVGTPLHVAACRGHTHVIRALLEAGADVHVVNSGGFTALDLAMHGEHEAAVQLLMAAGALPTVYDHDQVPTLFKLLQYATVGDTDRAKQLLEAGVDPDLADEGVAGAVTALHCAAEMGRTGTVVALLEAGANVNSRLSNGETPLHGAAKNGHAEAVAALLEARADVNAQDGSGATPLDLGLSSRKLESSRIIAEAGGLTCTFGSRMVDSDDFFYVVVAPKQSRLRRRRHCTILCCSFRLSW